MQITAIFIPLRGFHLLILFSRRNSGLQFRMLHSEPVPKLVLRQTFVDAIRPALQARKEME